MSAHTVQDMIACVEREIRIRRKVYPAWIARGRMTDARATQEIELMMAVRAFLLEHGGVTPTAPAQGSLFEGPDTTKGADVCTRR